MSIWKGNSLRTLHGHLGMTAEHVRDGRTGMPDPRAWTIDGGILVRVVTVWRALWSLLLNKPFEGVMLIERRGYRRPVIDASGRPAGLEDAEDVGNPDVVLDFETYCRMVAGLKRAPLQSLEMPADDTEVT